MRALIAVLPGDGIGPEVTAQAVRVLHAIAAQGGHTFACEEALIGGVAMEATGDPWPAASRALVERADAVLLGAGGGPRWGDPSAPVRPEQGLFDLRAAMGTYANIRPVVAYPALAAVAPFRVGHLANVDLLFVRELTGGLYFGAKTHERDDAGRSTSATDTCTYTREEVERVVRVAAGFARRRRGRLVSVDKANVLATSRLWREVTSALMADEFPDVELEHALADAFAMQLLQAPSRYDVVVTENTFGDLLTDEAAVLAGSIGLLPSAALGDGTAAGHRRGLYEPIHGSAPDLTGRNVANPVGAILSAAMLLRHSLGLGADATRIEDAVAGALQDGWRTADCTVHGERTCSTSDMGDAVLARLGSTSPSTLAPV